MRRCDAEVDAIRLATKHDEFEFLLVNRKDSVGAIGLAGKHELEPSLVKSHLAPIQRRLTGKHEARKQQDGQASVKGLGHECQGSDRLGAR